MLLDAFDRALEAHEKGFAAWPLCCWRHLIEHLKLMKKDLLLDLIEDVSTTTSRSTLD
jgi:hypothetical protein